MRFACCCFFLGFSIFGQQVVGSSGAGRPAGISQPVESEPVKPEDRCTVEGTVTSSASGEPLRKANLMLIRADLSPGSPAMSYAGVSDAAGHFVIHDINPGKYRLNVERSGFVRQQYGSKATLSAGTILSLDKSQKLKDINFKLTPHGIVAGRVLDEDGDPVPNVNIQMLRSAYMRGKKQWVPAGGSNTNDLGEYRVFGLAPGRYVASATYRPNGFMLESVQGGGDSEGYAPTYYPGASTPESATSIEVTAGAQLRGMDIRLAKTKTVHIRGRLTGSNRPVRNAMIMLLPRSDMTSNIMGRSMSRPYNEKGEFVLSNVTPGSYTLSATVNDDGKTTSARMPLEVGNSPIEGITLQLLPPSEVNGRVKIEGGQVDTGISNIHITLQPKSAMMLGPGAQGGQLKDDNSFSFTNVQPDLYDLRIFGTPDGGYLKSVRVGDADVTESSIDFTNGVAGGDITVVIAISAGQITGTVQNEKLEPAPGAVVVLIPEGKRRELDRFFQTSSTDQNGNYTLKSIAPGEYRLFAFDTVEYGAYQDPEWLKPYESKGERLSVKEGEKQSMQLKLVTTQAQQ